MPMAVVTCDPRFTGDLGTLGRWLASRGFDVTLVSRLEPIPAETADDADLLVMLGSPWSLARPMDRPDDDARAAASIDSELALVCRRLANEGPILGLCFGGQLLCTALGGQVDQLGTGLVMMWERASTAVEPLDSRWLYMHEDHVCVPDDVEVLAEAHHAAAAFRRGRAWGLQFHPEADSELLRQWLSPYAPDDRPDGADAALAFADADPAGIDASAFALFDHIWAEMVSV